MFENIKFLSYQITDPVTPVAVKSKYSANQDSYNNHHTPSNLPANLKNADFLISGRIETFPRPPITDFTVKNLFHMEAFSIFHCDKNFFTQRKDYNSYLILYTYNGNGLLEYLDKIYTLSEGDGFFIDCNIPHRYQTYGNHWKHSVLHLNGPLLSHIFNQYIQNGSAVFSQPVIGKYQTALENLLTLYSTAQPYRDLYASNRISNILLDLLSTSYSNNERNSLVPETLQYLIEYMEHHFSSDLTLDFLSEFSGISKYYLSREFKRYTDFSLYDYLIQLRIDHAKSLLQSTTLPANKIAHSVGIHDANNFTNLFKKKVGMTPGQYRKTIKYQS